jgi:hypothetical protein
VSSTYTARITSAARDLAGGNPLAGDFAWTFTTGASTWLATTASGAPGYLAHSAIWTGTRMIVWGQDATGAAYDPGADAWQAISPIGAPTARSSHHAVWSGSEMIVWGGFEAPGFSGVSTGGRYDPQTDTWRATSTANAPSPRTGASVVWTGTEMIVWGGNAMDASGHLSDGAAYDPANDSWRPIATAGAPSGRATHTAVWTGTEMIVWGGVDANLSWTGTGGRYNPATDSWQATTIAGAPIGRNNHAAVWTGTRMIVWGGNSGAVGNPALDTGGRYDPATDAWQAMTKINSPANPPAARSLHTAAWTGSEMLVWGGIDSSGLPLNSGGRYNPSTSRWSQIDAAGAPPARTGQTGIWTGSALVVWGPAGTGGRFLP